MRTFDRNEGRAMVFTAPGEPLRLERYPLPELAEGEVLVRTTMATICGSDVHTYLGTRSTPCPTVLGHEVLGEVAALGPGAPVVDDRGAPLAVGDRVTWTIAASCGGCFFCEHDLPQKCQDLFKYGHEPITARHAFHGGLADHVHLARGTTIYRVPEAIPDAVACPANCATATVAAALRLGGGRRDRVVVVQGLGMLGVTACAMADHGGARAVIACDLDARRAARAEAFGATAVVCGPTDDAAVREAVHQASDGRGADLVLEMSGSGAACDQGLALLRTGGVAVWVGAAKPTDPVPVDPEQMIRRMLTIRGLHNYGPADLRAALDFLAAAGARYPFDSLVSRVFPLGEAEDAFRCAVEEKEFRVALRP